MKYVTAYYGSQRTASRSFLSLSGMWVGEGTQIISLAASVLPYLLSHHSGPLHPFIHKHYKLRKI